MFDKRKPKVSIEKTWLYGIDLNWSILERGNLRINWGVNSYQGLVHSSPIFNKYENRFELEDYKNKNLVQKFVEVVEIMVNVNERLATRGKAMARMGLVEREGNDSHAYLVRSPFLRGKQQTFRVAGDWKSASCSCLDWEANKDDRYYFCEHKWAVYYLLMVG